MPPSSKQPPRPFIREKTMWIIIALLTLTLLLVVFTQMDQGRRFRQFRSGMPMMRGAWRFDDREYTPTPMNVPSSTTSGTSMMPVTNGDNTLYVSETGRLPLGSLVSPDGQWSMQVVETGTPETTIDHRIVLRGLKNQPNRVLATQSETAKTVKPEEPGTHLWHAAGWSKDGKNVYVTSEQVFGYGFDSMPVKTFGHDLWEVNVQTGAMKNVLTIAKGEAIFGNGILDVSAAQNQVLSILNGKVSLSGLHGEGKRMIVLSKLKSTDALVSMLLHPDGIHAALLFDRIPQAPEENRTAEPHYALLNLKTNAYKDLGVTVLGGQLSWKDTKTLSVSQQGSPSEQYEVQLP